MSGFFPHIAMIACTTSFGFFFGVLWHMARQQERDAVICGAIGQVRQRLDALHAALQGDLK